MSRPPSPRDLIAQAHLDLEHHELPPDLEEEHHARRADTLAGEVTSARQGHPGEVDHASSPAGPKFLRAKGRHGG